MGLNDTQPSLCSSTSSARERIEYTILAIGDQNVVVVVEAVADYR